MTLTYSKIEWLMVPIFESNSRPMTLTYSKIESHTDGTD